MPKYLVFNSDDLLPTSAPARDCGADWEEAWEHAAAVKGYVVLRTSVRDRVTWVSPKLDVYRMMAGAGAVVRAASQGLARGQVRRHQSAPARAPRFGGRVMVGRPVTPPRVARLQREAWTRACRHSALSQAEIADVIGMSLATVRSYSSASGNIPSEEAIAAVKRDNLLRALDTIADRYGNDSVSVGGPRP